MLNQDSLGHGRVLEAGSFDEARRGFISFSSSPYCSISLLAPFRARGSGVLQAGGGIMGIIIIGWALAGGYFLLHMGFRCIRVFFLGRSGGTAWKVSWASWSYYGTADRHQTSLETERSLSSSEPYACLPHGGLLDRMYLCRDGLMVL